MNLVKVAFVVRVETTTLLTLTTAWGNSMADFKAMAIPPLDDRGTSCEANTNQTSGLWQEVSTQDFRWLDSTKVLYLIRFSVWVMADWDGTMVPHLRLALDNTIVHGTATTTSEGVVERDMSAVWGEKEKDFLFYPDCTKNNIDIRWWRVRATYDNPQRTKSPIKRHNMKEKAQNSRKKLKIPAKNSGSGRHSPLTCP